MREESTKGAAETCSALQQLHPNLRLCPVHVCLRVEQLGKNSEISLSFHCIPIIQHTTPNCTAPHRRHGQAGYMQTAREAGAGQALFRL